MVGSDASSGPREGEPCIQPNGCLIALDNDWSVVACSSNVAEFLGLPASDLLGRPLADVSSGETIHELRNLLAVLRHPDSAARGYHIAFGGNEGRHLDVRMHRTEDHVILEAFRSEKPGNSDAADMVRGLIDGLDEIRDVEELLNMAARQARALTAYDRVCIFTELPGNNKTCSQAGRRDYEGQPAGLSADKPNRVELVADVEAKPVGIDPVDADLDLEGALLCWPIAATKKDQSEPAMRALLRLPLEVLGRQVGEILCQHETPRVVGLRRLASLELFAQMLAMRLEIETLRSADS